MPIIKLTRNKETLVDERVYKAVGHLKWYCASQGYASRNIWSKTMPQSKIVFLHHCVIGYPINGLQVDHINRNKLDNRLENLRFVTQSGNRQNIGLTKSNKSGYIGISWNPRYSWWEVKYKGKYLGVRKTLKAAIELQLTPNRERQALAESE